MKHPFQLSLCAAVAFLAFTCSPHAIQAQGNSTAQNNSGAQTANTNTAASSAAARSQWSSHNTHISKATRQEAMKMVPVEATLSQSIDARHAHQGETVRARLAGGVHLKNGTDLPGGTVLMGKVTRDVVKPDNVRLAVCFNQARLPHGRTIPIKATLVSVNPPAPQFAGSQMASNSEAAAAWTPQTLMVKQVGAVSGATMYSNIAARNSALFVSRKKDNVKIDSGSQFALAIAPARHQAQQQNHQNSPAM